MIGVTYSEEHSPFGALPGMASRRAAKMPADAVQFGKSANITFPHGCSTCQSWEPAGFWGDYEGLAGSGEEERFMDAYLADDPGTFPGPSDPSTFDVLFK
jgi:hypothetical protein